VLSQRLDDLEAAGVLVRRTLPPSAGPTNDDLVRFATLFSDLEFGAPSRE
jgi:hypothetical protein